MVIRLCAYSETVLEQLTPNTKLTDPREAYKKPSSRSKKSALQTSALNKIKRSYKITLDIYAPCLKWAAGRLLALRSRGRYGVKMNKVSAPARSLDKAPPQTKSGRQSGCKSLTTSILQQQVRRSQIQ